MDHKPWLETFEGHTPVVDPEAFVHPRAVLIGQVEVGAQASIWPNTTLRGDDGRITIGARTSIQDGTVVHLTGGLSHTSVGQRVTVGHNVTLHGATVEDDCLIGMGAIILDNAHIGHHSLVGAGALVTQNTIIPPYSLVLGSPARVVRRLKDRELAQIDQSWQVYAAHAKRYRDHHQGGGS
jgi:carbonic anhydrase/acetyltransferase-like protein (isoleucine patch superfamily)